MKINQRLIILILCIVSVIYSLIFTDENKYFSYIFILPLSFFILNLLFYKIMDFLKNSIVFKTFLIQSIIRYCIIPILLISGNNFLSGNYSNYTNISIFIMVLELSIIFLISHFISRKQQNAFTKKNENIVFVPSSIKYIIVLIVCFLLVIFTGYVNKINFIWSLNDFINNKNTEEVSGSAIGLISFNLFRILLMVMLIGFVYKSKIIKDKLKIYLYLLIIILSSITIIGVSRLSIVSFTVPFLLLILMMVNKNDKSKLFYFFIILFIPIIIYTSVSKFASNKNSYTAENLISVSTVNAYFSGIGNMNVGVDLYFDDYQNNSYNPIIIFNDYFQNIPILSNFTTDNKSSILYNYKIYNIENKADQIVPLAISGLLHFGIIGSVLYSPLFMLLSYYFERRAYKSNNILIKYIYISLSISTSMVFMLNIGSIISNVFKGIFFVLIPYKFIKFFK